MDEKFWAEVHKRTKKVLDGVVCLRQGADARNPILVRHRFVLLKVSVEKMLEVLNGAELAFGSRDAGIVDHAMACFVRSITGYHRLLECMVDKPEKIIQTINLWKESLEVVVRLSL